MPNCFTLTRHGDSKPTNLASLDEELCSMLGVEVHPTQYAVHWFDTIGLMLALGRTLPECVERMAGRAALPNADEDDHHRLAIAQYLCDGFTSNAWCER
jgi:hypothetical protein